MSRHLATAAAASASAFSLVESDTSLPPTKSQLQSLTAVPAGLVRAGALKKRRKMPGKLVKDAQIVSITFDGLGKRPMPRNGLSLEQQITLEMDSYSMSYITASATPGVSTYGGVNFTLGAFVGATALTAVFDQYRIEQVELWLECAVPNSTLSFPEVMSAVDLDDSNTPSTVGQVLDKPGAIATSGPAGHYHKFRPHMAVAAYSGAFTSYTNIPATWIDCNSPNVQHYGLKLALTSNAATALSYNISFRCVISFRSPVIA